MEVHDKIRNTKGNLFLITNIFIQPKRALSENSMYARSILEHALDGVEITVWSRF